MQIIHATSNLQNRAYNLEVSSSRHVRNIENINVFHIKFAGLFTVYLDSKVRMFSFNNS
jgi:hypothetical protein